MAPPADRDAYPVRTTIDAAKAPAMIGSVSHAVRHGSVLYCSGMIPIDPESGEIRAGSPTEEVRSCLRNVAAICEAGGTDLGQALRITVYMTDLAGYGEAIEAYREFFPEDPPARVVIGVASLPLGAGIEIEATVAVPEPTG